MGAAGLDSLVVLLQQHLGPAERVPDRLLEQPGEEDTEEPVPEVVDDLHRLLFHRVDEAGAIDEAALAGGDRSVKTWKILRGHGEIRVQDHQYLAAGGVKALA